MIGPDLTTAIRRKRSHMVLALTPIHISHSVRST